MTSTPAAPLSQTVKESVSKKNDLNFHASINSRVFILPQDQTLQSRRIFDFFPEAAAKAAKNCVLIDPTEDEP